MSTQTSDWAVTPVQDVYNILTQYDQIQNDPKTALWGEIILLVATEALVLVAATYHLAALMIKIPVATVTEIQAYFNNENSSIAEAFGWQSIQRHAAGFGRAVSGAVLPLLLDTGREKTLSDRFLRRVAVVDPGFLMWNRPTGVPVPTRRVDLPRPIRPQQVQEVEQEQEVQEEEEVIVEPEILEALPEFNGTPEQKAVFTKLCEDLGLSDAIAFEPMRDPVVIASGQTFDREGGIQDWVKKQGNCPTTKKEIEDKRLTPNLWAREVIEDIQGLVHSLKVEPGEDKQKEAISTVVQSLTLPECPAKPVVVISAIPGFKMGATYDKSAIPAQYQASAYIVDNVLATSVTGQLASLK